MQFVQGSEEKRREPTLEEKVKGVLIVLGIVFFLVVVLPIGNWFIMRKRRKQLRLDREVVDSLDLA